MPSLDTLPERFRPAPDGRYRVLKLRAGVAAAAAHRRRLAQVKFIGVTGSGGKTTTKELIAAALGSQVRGRKSPRGRNQIADVARTILRTTKKDAFCVIEVAAGASRGIMAEKADLLRPDIAVVTTVGGDHFKTFRSLDATAAEKRALVSAVAEGGTAVLNADDPRVQAMGDGFRGRVITYGCSPEATVRADHVSSAWPQRLSFTLCWSGRHVPVRTRLCGKHWVTSALAAFSVAIAMELPLEAVADAISGFEPLPGRMRPVLRDGITFIQDDIKAPLWSLDTAFDFLAEARASRKIIVIGTISDYAGDGATKYVRAARRALEVADEVVFAGPNARHALKAAGQAPAGALRAFQTVPEASAYFRSSLREGDLVLLKGSRDADDLDRVMPAG